MAPRFQHVPFMRQIQERLKWYQTLLILQAVWPVVLTSERAASGIMALFMGEANAHELNANALCLLVMISRFSSMNRNSGNTKQVKIVSFVDALDGIKEQP